MLIWTSHDSNVAKPKVDNYALNTSGYGVNSDTWHVCRHQVTVQPVLLKTTCFFRPR